MVASSTERYGEVGANEAKVDGGQVRAMLLVDEMRFSSDFSYEKEADDD